MLFLLKRKIRRLIGFMKPVPQCFYDFAKLNSPWWENVEPVDKSNGNVLYVDRKPFPLAMVVTMPAVKKIADAQKKRVIIGLPYIHNNKQTKMMYSSYGVDDYITIDAAPWYMWVYFAYNALKIIYTVDGVNKLLNLSYKGVKFGEELYDAIIRNTNGLYTLDKLRVNHLSIIIRAYVNIYNAEKFFSCEHNTLVYGDCDYEMQGWPKMAIHYIGNCYQVNDLGIVEHQEKKENKIFNCGKLTKEIYEQSVKKITPQKLEQFLQKHFCGGDVNYLNRDAYYNKTSYSLEKLYDVLNVVDKNRKNVLIAAHAFSDTPHYACNLIFKDYFTWLFETIKILQANDKINIFVKEHPTAYYYGETGSVAYYVKKYNMSNIYVLPQDFNTISVFSIMDAVVTCQGTIGLEATIYGIPVFTAGQGYYYGFGIDNNSKTLEEYTYKMLHITEYPKPTELQMKTAKNVLYLTRKKDEMKREILEIEDIDVKMNWQRSDVFVAQCQEVNKKLLKGVNPKEGYEDLLSNIKLMHDY